LTGPGLGHAKHRGGGRKATLLDDRDQDAELAERDISGAYDEYVSNPLALFQQMALGAAITK
jgi:hypothetical protein